MNKSIIKMNQKYIVPTIYVNINKDGSRGSNLLFLSRIYENKKDVAAREDDYESDLVFTVKKNFDDSLIHTFTKRKNTNIITMKDLVVEKYFASIKPFNYSIWERSSAEQLDELKKIRDKFASELLGTCMLVSNLSEFNATLTEPFVKFDGDKVYYKKISTPMYTSLAYQNVK